MKTSKYRFVLQTHQPSDKIFSISKHKKRKDVNEKNIAISQDPSTEKELKNVIDQSFSDKKKKKKQKEISEQSKIIELNPEVASIAVQNNKKRKTVTERGPKKKKGRKGKINQSIFDDY